jgi:hypothetical protein
MADLLRDRLLRLRFFTGFASLWLRLVLRLFLLFALLRRSRLRLREGDFSAPLSSALLTGSSSLPLSLSLREPFFFLLSFLDIFTALRGARGPP